MKSLRKIVESVLDEKKPSQDLYQVKIRANFYSGKYYETGIDSIFVLASSPGEAMDIAEKNIPAIDKHFREKKYQSGKSAIAKNDKRGIKSGDVKSASLSKMKNYHNVLTKSGKFEQVDLKEVSEAKNKDWSETESKILDVLSKSGVDVTGSGPEVIEWESKDGTKVSLVYDGYSGSINGEVIVYDVDGNEEDSYKYITTKQLETIIRKNKLRS